MAQKPLNPFYPLLIVVGVIFCITACAYGVMTVRLIDPMAAADGAAGEHGLIRFLDEHGVTLLLGQLGMLAVASMAAMGTDEYWTRRAERAGPALAEAEPGGNESPEQPSAAFRETDL